jgi:hypothetical protein
MFEAALQPSVAFAALGEWLQEQGDVCDVDGKVAVSWKRGSRRRRPLITES